MSIKTKQFAIKLLNNWRQCNHFKQLTKNQKHLFYMCMANLLQQMSLEYALDQNWDKVLVFCKQASSYINMTNWKPSSSDAINMIPFNRLSKFTSLSTLQLLHQNEFAIGSAFSILYHD